MLHTVSAMWSWWWDSRATLTALVSIFAVFWFVFAVKKSRKVVRLPPLPPGPRGLPLVGYLPFLGTELHTKFEELARAYGPIYKFWLGKKLCVVVSSPSLVKQVVRDQDTIFANRDPPIAALAATYGGADIGFAPYCHDWRKLRKIFVREMLSNANLDSSYALRREEVNKSIGHVYGKIGTTVDLGELAFLTVLNATMSMLWGAEDEGADVGAQFKTMLAELMVLLGKPNVSDFFPALARFDLQGIERQAKRISQWIEAILDSAIEKRMNMAKGKGIRIEERKDFLQILLEIRDQADAATSISMNQLKALLLVCPIFHFLPQ